MIIDRKAALVMKVITNNPIEIPEGKEKIDMCKAVEDLLKEREAKGIEQSMDIIKDSDIMDDAGNLRL